MLQHRDDRNRSKATGLPIAHSHDEELQRCGRVGCDRLGSVQSLAYGAIDAATVIISDLTPVYEFHCIPAGR